jgi:hypothetical protein
VEPDQHEVSSVLSRILCEFSYLVGGKRADAQFCAACGSGTDGQADEHPGKRRNESLRKDPWTIAK